MAELNRKCKKCVWLLDCDDKENESPSFTDNKAADATTETSAADAAGADREERSVVSKLITLVFTIHFSGV